MATNFKIPSDLDGRNTPLVWLKRENGVQGSYFPAPFLPLGRFEKKFETHIVIGAGKVVATAAQGNVAWTIPAGYKKQVADYVSWWAANYATDNATTVAAARTAAGSATFGDLLYEMDVYSSTDVAEGVLNAKGQPVQAGELVVESFFSEDVSISSTGTDATLDATALAWKLSEPCGAAIYNYFRFHSNEYPFSVVDITGQRVSYNYTHHNFNVQDRVAYTKNGVMDIAVLEAGNTGGAIMTNLVKFVADNGVAFERANYMHKYITYTKTSDYKLWEEGTDAEKDRVGQVQFPKPISEMPFNLLNYVRSGYSQLPEQYRVAGDATGGLDDHEYLHGPNVLGAMYATILFF